MGFTAPKFSLAKMFAGIAADADGATAAAMSATQRSAEQCFAEQRDPAGRPWAPLAASTLRGREAAPILGSIGESLQFVDTGSGRWAVRSATKPYAGFHLGPDSRTGRPARPYLPTDPESAAAVTEAVGEALRQWLRSHMRGAA